MTDPDWVAEGIEWAESVGGIALEVYTRPGFTGGQKAVRPYTSGGGAASEMSDSEGLLWIEGAPRLLVSKEGMPQWTSSEQRAAIIRPMGRSCR